MLRPDTVVCNVTSSADTAPPVVISPLPFSCSVPPALPAMAVEPVLVRYASLNVFTLIAAAFVVMLLLVVPIAPSSEIKFNVPVDIDVPPASVIVPRPSAFSVTDPVVLILAFMAILPSVVVVSEAVVPDNGPDKVILPSLANWNMPPEESPTVTELLSSTYTLPDVLAVRLVALVVMFCVVDPMSPCPAVKVSVVVDIVPTFWLMSPVPFAFKVIVFVAARSLFRLMLPLVRVLSVTALAVNGP